MKSLTVNSNGKVRGLLVASLIIPVLLLGALVGFVLFGRRADSKVLTYDFSEPLNGATAAKIVIDNGDGNLAVDPMAGGELLASGKLQYLENQSLPAQTVKLDGGMAALTLKAGGKGQTWGRLPWEACNGATEWQVQLNPSLPSDITAHSDGGNVKLDLAGMVVTRLAADTGGGNMEVILPDAAANLNVTAKTGAGNVTVTLGATSGSSAITASSGAGNATVTIPGNLAARIHTSGGLGKTTIDPRFSKIDDKTYQSPNYDSAADRVEITISSGAGDVIVNTK